MFSVSLPLFLLLLHRADRRCHHRRRRGLVAPAQMAPPRAPPVRRLKAAHAETAALRRRLETRRRRAAAASDRRHRVSASALRSAACPADGWKPVFGQDHAAEKSDARRHRRGDRPRTDLSGADRGVARGVPRRHRDAAAPHPHDRAAGRQRSEAAADAGLDQFRRAPRRLQAGQRLSGQSQDRTGRRSTAATC